MIAKAFSVETAIVYSADGGSISFGKEEVIQRAKADLEERLRGAIPEGMKCSLVTGEAMAFVQ